MSNFLFKSKFSLLLYVAWMVLALFLSVGIILGKESATLAFIFIACMWVFFRIIDEGVEALQAWRFQNELKKHGIDVHDLSTLANHPIKVIKLDDDKDSQ